LAIEYSWFLRSFADNFTLPIIASKGLLVSGSIDIAPLLFTLCYVTVAMIKAESKSTKFAMLGVV
jgi:hypothetical protein